MVKCKLAIKLANGKQPALFYWGCEMKEKIVKNYKELMKLKDFEGRIYLDLEEEIENFNDLFKGELILRKGDA